MQHNIPVVQLGGQGEDMARAVEKCVHCGFCLPACPTYELMGEEMDSPRGRIFLMKEALEGAVPLDETTPYLDKCLGCVACETACPSGVEYGALVTSFRGHAEPLRRRSWSDRLLRRMILSTLPYPWRFRWAARTGRLVRPLRGWLPRRLRQMLELIPRRLPRSQPLPEVYPAEGSRVARVALLATCAQQVLAPEINWASLRVLARNGVETVIPKRQVCCGALAAHTGALASAARLAAHNLKVFPTDVDAVLTNAAGCGSGLHEYPLWLRDTPLQAAAQQLAGKVMDISQFLDQLQLQPASFPQPRRVAYHDACHLAHAQRVRQQPRRLLAAIGNLELVELGDDTCCGSAGTYNIEQPETAEQLGRRKAAAVQALQVDMVASGNIGCMTQLATHLQGSPPVLHTINVLDQAYGSR